MADTGRRLLELDVRGLGGFRGLARGPHQLVGARAQSGKSMFRQLREILALRRFRVGPKEYFKYRLFDDNRYTPEQKREFTGVRFQDTVYRAVNDPGLIAPMGAGGSWHGTIDKVLFDCLMRSSGILTPPLLGLFDAAGALYGDVRCLSTQPELTEFLCTLHDGFFGKPARAHTGHGAVSALSVKGDVVRLFDGSELPLSQVSTALASTGRALIQRRVTPHPVLRRAIGRALPTLRVVVLRDNDGSRIHRSVVRIPVGKNMVDNFDGGKGGNLVGWVDTPTGQIDHVVSGWGLQQERHKTHPDTGADLEGLLLPDWPEAMELVIRASRVLTAMPLQSWDLALTDHGPMMVEVNDKSSRRATGQRTRLPRPRSLRLPSTARLPLAIPSLKGAGTTESALYLSEHARALRRIHNATATRQASP